MPSEPISISRADGLSKHEFEEGIIAMGIPDHGNGSAIDSAYYIGKCRCLVKVKRTRAYRPTMCNSDLMYLRSRIIRTDSVGKHMRKRIYIIVHFDYVMAGLPETVV